MKTNHFEEEIDRQLLELVSNGNKDISEYIQKLPKKEQRARVLSILDNDRGLFLKISKIIGNDEYIPKCDYILDVVSMIRQYVQVSETEKKRFGEVMTPVYLVEEMLNKLPEDVWSNPHLKWLDPCNGIGVFPSMIVSRLLMEGLKDTIPDSEERYRHIVENMIYVCELQPKNMFLFNCIFDPRDEYLLNEFCGSFLSEEFNDHCKNIWNVDKFDIIIGNPPYQESFSDGERKSLSTNLWSKFIDKSINLIKDGGNLLMITPASWAGPTKNLSGGRKILKDIMGVNNTTFVSLNPKLNEYFPGVGSTFSYFNIEKSPNTGNTIIELSDNVTINVDISKYDSLPKVSDPLAYSINEKYFSKVKGEVIRGQLQSASIIQYRENSDGIFVHPAYHTSSKGGRIWYTNNPHPNKNDKKVIISLSGKYAPYKEDGQIGFTDMCLAYIVRDGESLDGAFSVINSKLFHFVMNSNKWSGFNNKEIIRRFALPKLDKVYSDEDVYDFFDLNSAERVFLNNWKQ